MSSRNPKSPKSTAKADSTGSKTASPPSAGVAAAAGIKTRYIVAAVGLGVVAFVAAMVWMLAPKAGGARSAAELAALQRPHAAVLGSPDAKVSIVEFLDPACETCREFYPLVKGLLADNPGRIRLAVRLVAFHPGSDVAVRALEAAKRQDRFWPVLEHLLATQPRWVKNHRVDADALLAQLQGADADLARLQVDMQSPQVAANVAQDLEDAKALKVTATPEYFVNGRGLPEFGWQPLRTLVADELAKSYQ